MVAPCKDLVCGRRSLSGVTHAVSRLAWLGRCCLRTIRRPCVAYAVRYDGRMVREPKRNRVIRVPDTLWHKARQRADERGETVSQAVRDFLRRYSK